jgi:hypothetical protein
VHNSRQRLYHPERKSIVIKSVHLTRVTKLEGTRPLAPLALQHFNHPEPSSSSSTSSSSPCMHQSNKQKSHSNTTQPWQASGAALHLFPAHNPKWLELTKKRSISPFLFFPIRSSTFGSGNNEMATSFDGLHAGLVFQTRCTRFFAQLVAKRVRCHPLRNRSDSCKSNRFKSLPWTENDRNQDEACIPPQPDLVFKST